MNTYSSIALGLALDMLSNQKYRDFHGWRMVCKHNQHLMPDSKEWIEYIPHTVPSGNTAKPANSLESRVDAVARGMLW